MRVAISGSSGLIGTALASALRARGDSVTPMVRGEADDGQVAWDPVAGTIDAVALANHDAVVNLAGEGIATKRWTQDQKARIRDSRRHGTALIARTLGRLAEAGAADAGPGGPMIMVSGSAIGYYGNRGEEELTEESAPGGGFLADLCREWEQATRPAEDAGVRVVHVRTGIVLTPDGGALAKQLPLFKLGVGGALGSGRQWFSWVSLDDEVGAILHALDSTDLAGPVNLTAPNPVTQHEFAKTLGKVLHRPAVLPVPVKALGLVLGRELAADLTGSQRVLPTRLEGHGYQFADPTLDGALRRMLRKNS